MERGIDKQVKLEIFGGYDWDFDEVKEETMKLCSYMPFDMVDRRMNDIWWVMKLLRTSFKTTCKLCLDTIPGFTANLDKKSFEMGYNRCSVLVFENSMSEEMQKKMLEELSEKSS